MNTADQDSAVLLIWKGNVDGLRKLILRERSCYCKRDLQPFRPIQVMDSEEQHNAADLLVADLYTKRLLQRLCSAMIQRKKWSMLKERRCTRTLKEEEPSKKLKLRTETIDALRNYLRIVDFEQNAQDRESLEAISVITEFKVIDSSDGEYLIIFRANNHFRAFNTLWEILAILDR
ncbi:hypothetical protein Tco_0990797 [Tanacetum coccineum]|uniref:Uncharacterized protein n=1 Tax=Tanacetum coccineum TaxID=301880 RepID=A0ABQ5EY91_9ASTR